MAHTLWYKPGMLDLEVVPERSLGNEQWEFILGKYFVHIRLWELCFLLPKSLFSLSPAVQGMVKRKKGLSLFIFILDRNARCPVCTDSQTTMSCNQICSGYVQRGGKLID